MDVFFLSFNFIKLYSFTINISTFIRYVEKDNFIFFSNS